MKRRVSLSSIVFLSLALCAAGERARLVSGPATFLSSPPVFSTAGGLQQIGSIVPTDEGWIVAWADDITVVSGADGYRRVLASRLRPDGTPVDITGLRLGTDAPFSPFTAVSDGSDARVLRLPRELSPREIPLSTISGAGVVSHSSLPSGYRSDYVPDGLAAAVSGTRTALLAHGQFMLYEGSRLLRTVDLGGFGQPSSIAATSSRFVVTWVAAGGVFMCQTLDLDGNVVGPTGGTGVGFPARWGAVATRESGALLAWDEGAWLRIATLDPLTGTVTKSASLFAEYAAPRIVWTGASYLVAWPDPTGHGILGVGVTSSGDLLDTEPRRLFDDYTAQFTLAARNGDVMMLYQSGDCTFAYCNTDVWVAPLGTSSGGKHLVSTAARVQDSPSVASSGSGFFAAWNEGNSALGTITVLADHQPTVPFTIESDGVLPAVRTASDSRGYLAVWLAYRGSRYFIEGAQISAENQPTTRIARSFSIDGGTDGNFGLAVGGSDAGFLVAWQQESAFHAVRVRSNGELVDVVPISAGGSVPVSPPSAVAFDGRDFVVTAITYGGTIDPSSTVFSLRVTPGGTASFDRTWATAEQGAISTSSVACGDGNCLVAWIQRAESDGLTWRLLGRRFRTGGAPIDSTPFVINVSEWHQGEPRLAWDGGRFIVSWSWLDIEKETTVIKARSINESGDVEQSDPFPADRLADSYPPAPIACNREGRCLLVYAAPVDDEALGRTPRRLFKRLFGEARHRPVRH